MRWGNLGEEGSCVAGELGEAGRCAVSSFA